MIAARWQKPGRTAPIRLVVVHCTVSPETATGAEAVANYFATVDRKASAHKVVDSDSVVTCVADEDTAYGAAGANADGLHLELVGMPDQTTEQWLDTYGMSMLPLAAGVVRDWCDRYSIPKRWLTVAEVADGTSKGLCTHKDVSDAFPEISTGHWDPGPGFPRDYFLTLVAPPPPQEDDMPNPPAVCNDSQGRTWYLVRGLDAELWGRVDDGPWFKYGGLISSGPDACSAGSGKVRVAARGGDGALWMAVLTAGVPANWVSLGGAS